MLGAFRRYPATLRWTVVSKASSRSIASCTRGTTRAIYKFRSFPHDQIILNARSFHYTAIRKEIAAATEHDATGQAVGEEYVSEKDILFADNSQDITKFQELADRGLVAERVIDNITQRMGIDTMTQVQSLTINEAMKGRDVLAQAKTGTGKTLAFLLPILQNILAQDSGLGQRQMPSRDSYASRAQDVRAIVISPTRELAEQIAVEAEKLVQGTGVKVQRAVGGTQKNMHSRKIRQEGCHILVGTPGRLNDLLTDEKSGLKAPKLSALVLDEADRLMDEGFWPEIQRIQKALPGRAERDRQTLMFSATMPNHIIKLVRETMKPDLHFVRTVQENEEPTHERVPQRLIVVPGLENQLPTLLELCERQITSGQPFKAIVYFQSTAEVVLASSIFFRLRRAAVAGEPVALGTDTRIYEIHGKLSQAARTKSADSFRKCSSGILMSTDVTARGLDFPNVSHVIQIGLPKDRDTYVHRLGRTARAGQEGEGWLILPSTNLNEARVRLGKLPIKRDNSLEAAKATFGESSGDPQENADQPDISGTTARFFAEVKKAAREVPSDQRDDVYMALLGAMAWMPDKQRLVEMMNRLASVQWGMQRPPSVGAGIASKLRLMGVPGLNIRARDEYERTSEARNGSRSPRGFDTSRAFSGIDKRAGRPDGRSGVTRGRGRGHERAAYEGGRNRTGFKQSW